MAQTCIVPYELQAEARNFVKAISKLHQSQSAPILLPNVSADVAMGAKIPVQDMHVGIAQYLAIKLEDSEGWFRCSLPASEDALAREEDMGEHDAMFKLRLTQRQANYGPSGLRPLASSPRSGSLAAGSTSRGASPTVGTACECRTRVFCRTPTDHHRPSTVVRATTRSMPRPQGGACARQSVAHSLHAVWTHKGKVVCPIRPPGELERRRHLGRYARGQRE